jgi:magnesium and cobalt transporter
MKQDSDNGKPPSSSGWLDWIKSWWRTSSAPQTRQDLLNYLETSADKNIITPEMLNMIEGVVGVADLQARDIMVPRYQMTVVHHDADFESLLNQIIEPGFSRFPVIGDSRDEILGIMLAKDLLGYCMADQQPAFNLMDQIRPVFFVPESKRLNTLLKEFRSAHTHMAIVFNEYGGVAGLVTIEDVIEQIVGEIEDEHDIPEELSIKKLSQNQYMVSALTPVVTINEYFGTEYDVDEFDTIGGLVTHHFGHLPKRGETINLNALHFKVVQASSRRIQYLLVNDAPANDE